MLMMFNSLITSGGEALPYIAYAGTQERTRGKYVISLFFDTVALKGVKITRSIKRSP